MPHSSCADGDEGRRNARPNWLEQWEPVFRERYTLWPLQLNITSAPRWTAIIWHPPPPPHPLKKSFFLNCVLWMICSQRTSQPSSEERWSYVKIRTKEPADALCTDNPAPLSLRGQMGSQPYITIIIVYYGQRHNPAPLSLCGQMGSQPYITMIIV